MDTRESKTPEEELQRLKEINEPEDFDNPEPDEDQPEAKAPASGLPLLLPITVVAIIALVAAVLIFGNGSP